MKIDTDDWLTLAEACKAAGLSQSTGYRLAKHLQIIEVFFGVKCVQKQDVSRMMHERRRVGNQRWIASSDDAAQAAIKSVESRLSRVEKHGHTKAEKKRNKRLSVIGRTLGGRKKTVKTQP